jgi:hypothetical protein
VFRDLDAVATPQRTKHALHLAQDVVENRLDTEVAMAIHGFTVDDVLGRLHVSGAEKAGGVERAASAPPETTIDHAFRIFSRGTSGEQPDMSKLELSWQRNAKTKDVAEKESVRFIIMVIAMEAFVRSPIIESALKSSLH